MSGAALPPAALTLQAVRPKDRDAAALSTANESLEASLLPGIDSLQSALEALAQQRARAVQDALLSSGEVESSRVFLVAANAQPASGGRIRIALSLK